MSYGISISYGLQVISLANRSLMWLITIYIYLRRGSLPTARFGTEGCGRPLDAGASKYSHPRLFLSKSNAESGVTGGIELIL